MTTRRRKLVWPPRGFGTMEEIPFPAYPYSPPRDYTPVLPRPYRVTMEFLPVEPPVDEWYTVRMQWKIWRGGALR